jgi:hypothetical protein
METLDHEGEQDESSRLATEIAETITTHIGAHKWSGDNPFTIQILDQEQNVAHIYNIRRGTDWMTIQEQVSNNPRLVQSFSLDRKNGSWTYIDPYLIKYKESSLDKLQAAFDRLKIALEASAPKSVDNKKLLTSEI